MSPRALMRLRLWLLIPLLLTLAVPAVAGASPKQVVADCTDDGVLSKTYSRSDYTKALADLPSDVDEYSDCRDVIRRAQLSAASKRTSGSGGGPSSSSGTGGGGSTAGGGTSGATGSAPPATPDAAPGTDPLQAATAQERQGFEAAVVAGAEPVRLDGAPVTPGTLGGASIHGLSDLPTPLLVLLALLGAGALGALGVGARRLVVGRRPI